MEKKVYYECPICFSRFDRESDASDCMFYCQNDQAVSRTIFYLCSVCGQEFNSQYAAEAHEAKCANFSQRTDNPTCMNCAHRDKEGFYHRPCRQYHHAPAIPACELFEWTTK